MPFAIWAGICERVEISSVRHPVGRRSVLLIEVITPTVAPCVRGIAVGEAMPVHLFSAKGRMRWQHPRGRHGTPVVGLL